MSEDPRPDAGELDAVAPEVVSGIRLMPVVHDRIEITAAVRACLEHFDPAAIAVELPTTWAGAVRQAIRRLPQISVVLLTEPGEPAQVWCAAPGEPFCEALRWAHERGRPTFFVDPDLPYGGRHRDPVPDPYALLDGGPRSYFQPLVDALTQAGSTPGDRAREAGMAHHLRQARDRVEGPVLALVGAAHVARLAERLTEPAATPLARTRRQLEVRHLHPESLTALLADPPLAHAVFERLRGSPSKEEEPPPKETPLEATVSRPLHLVEASIRLISRNPGDPVGTRAKKVVAYAAQHSCRELAWAPDSAQRFPDRWALGRALWSMAAASYREQTLEPLERWQSRRFFDFAYRYARLRGQLVPGLLEWTVAGRGVADDNLAWELFEAARAFPWQKSEAEIPTVKIDGDQLDLGTRKIRFRRRFFRVKSRPVALPVRNRPKPPTDPAEWLEAFDGELCSYPPEDLAIESYGGYLRHRAGTLVAAERTRSEPFSHSLLDGIDLRETLRRRAGGNEREIWVREQGKAPGRAGAVVVIFDRDEEGTAYPYLMSWLGEHEQESDMAFYSTDPAAQVVGPGILRATYGGFLMTYPPGRLFDVWQDEEYAHVADKASVLTMAAIDYSQEKLVAHVAAQPPGAALARYASLRRKRLVHLPLGSLSPAALARIRTLHILSGHDKRKIARDYIR